MFQPLLTVLGTKECTFVPLEVIQIGQKYGDKASRLLGPYPGPSASHVHFASLPGSYADILAPFLSRGLECNSFKSNGRLWDARVAADITLRKKNYTNLIGI